MPYLRRRIESLVEGVESGTVVLTAGAQGMVTELKKVRRHENGEIDLSTVSPALRSMVRAYYLTVLAFRSEEEDSAQASAEAVSPSDIVNLSRELLALQEEMFAAITGVPVHNFPSTIDGIAASIRASAQGMRERVASMHRAEDDLRKFYAEKAPKLFIGSKQLPGLKLVHGGMQSYNGAVFDATRSMALYADTILIPDPVLRWLEDSNRNERNTLPRMLEDIRHLARLADLVRSDLPYPAVVVFPSWERSLELKDEATQDAIEMMMMQFWSHYLDERFEDLEEIFDFARRHEHLFTEKVVQNRLLVAPGGDGSEKHNEAVEIIKQNMQMWRSDEYMDAVKRNPDSVLVLMTILERLNPQYHMLENGKELGASPLMALGAQWRYFELLQRASVAMMRDVNTDPVAEPFIELSQRDYKWLGGVPFDSIVELRRRGENEQFRSMVNAEFSKLRHAVGDDVRPTAAELARALDSILRQHDKEARAIADKYAPKYAGQAVGAWITLAASMLPIFPALTPIVATGIGGAYLSAKAGEVVEKRKLKNTLTGILAASARVNE